jgi:hypothetical protein
MVDMLRLARFAPFALLALPTMAVAQAQSGFPQGIWSLQDENASVTVAGQTDRYYVNGVNLNWTSLPGAVPAPVAALGHTLFGQGEQRFSLGLLQQLYTPPDTSAIDPSPTQEPYAGYLVAVAGLTQDTATTRTLAQLDLGVIGADAGGELVQNNFHSIIGQKGTHGWAYQLPSEPAVDVSAARIWRVGLPGIYGLQADALPHVGGEVGLTQDNLQSGVALRLGRGLDNDFGLPLLTGPASGGDAYTSPQTVAWYVSLGLNGDLVAYDETLDGADFQPSRHVAAYPAVGSAVVGAGILWHDWRFSYAEVFQTTRYYHQPQTLHEYGSFSLARAF